jgi:hypothetical protein
VFLAIFLIIFAYNSVREQRGYLDPPSVKGNINEAVGYRKRYLVIILNNNNISQVYALFTVLKYNLFFVFRCFFHYHFYATCFSNSLPSSDVVPLTISLQFIVKIGV